MNFFRNFLVVLLFLIFSQNTIALASGERPLRIWVMNNDAVRTTFDVSKEDVEKAVEQWKKEGIIIENTINDLLLPTETRQSLALRIFGNEKFIKQLSDYRKTSGDSSFIAIEYIRWDDAYNRIMSAVGSDDIDIVPDIAQVGHSWAVDLANRGKLSDLTGKIDRNIFYPEHLAQSNAFQNKGFYAVPWFSEMRLLYYNRRFVKSPDEITDWKSFQTTCDQYTKKTGKPFIGFATAVSWNLLHNLAPWLWAGGGDLIKTKTIGPISKQTVVLDSPESLLGLHYLNHLSQSGCAVFPDTTLEITDRMFINGDLAAIITGPWIIKLLGDDWQDNFGVTALPAGPNGNQPFVGGSHLVVPSASQFRGNFERASRLVNYLTSTKPQLAFANISGFYPVNKEAFPLFFESTVFSEIEQPFKKAVVEGLSYPAFAGWGAVVENEFIRSHLWNIWRDIAQGVPDDVLTATTKNAAYNLRVKLFLLRIRNAGPFLASLIGAFILIGGLTLIWQRISYRKAKNLFEKKSIELSKISTERAILEGRILLHERTQKEQTRERDELKTAIEDLTQRAEQLRSELIKYGPRKAGDEKFLENFSVNWNGSVFINESQLRFENHRQASKFIEHLVRNACFGTSSVSCLWGYPLFGWTGDSIQTHPQRLFETMAAKINTAFKVSGAPPFIAKDRNNSCAWKLAWDHHYTISHCDIRKSMIEIEAAEKSLRNNLIDAAIEHLLIAWDHDQKNLDAFALAHDSRLASHLSKAAQGRMTIAFRKSREALGSDIKSLHAGIQALNALIVNNTVPKGLDKNFLEEEISRMKLSEEHLSRRFRGIFEEDELLQENTVQQDVLNKIFAVHQEIAQFKSQKITNDRLWTRVADSQNFLRLITLPHISSLINNFYNDDLRSKEDPRLVQLALISLLSQENLPKTLTGANDKDQTLTTVRKLLSKEINFLSSGLESHTPLM